MTGLASSWPGLRMVPSLDHRPGPARASAGIPGSSGVRRTRVVHLSKLQITASDWLYLQVQVIKCGHRHTTRIAAQGRSSFDQLVFFERIQQARASPTTRTRNYILHVYHDHPITN